MTCNGCQTCQKALTMRDRAAICVLCPDAWRDDGGVVGCRESAKTMVELLTTAACPRGKHGPGNPYSTFLGMRTRGLHQALRWVLCAFHKKHPRPSTFGGCGCWDRIKTIWERYTKSKESGMATTSYDPSLDDPAVAKYMKAKAAAAAPRPAGSFTGFTLAPNPDYPPRPLGAAPTPPDSYYLNKGDYRGAATNGMPPLTPPPPTTYGRAGMDSDPALMAWRAKNMPTPGPVAAPGSPAVSPAPAAAGAAPSNPTAYGPTQPAPNDPGRVNDAYVRRLRDTDQNDLIFRKYMNSTVNGKPYKDNSPENISRLEGIRGLNREHLAYQDSLQEGASGEAAGQELSLLQRMRMAGTEFGTKMLAQERGTELAQGAADEGEAKLRANLANDPKTAAAILAQRSSQAAAGAAQAGGEEQVAGSVASEKAAQAAFTQAGTSEKEIVEGASPSMNVIQSGMSATTNGGVHGDTLAGGTERHQKALDTLDANSVSPLEQVARIHPAAAARAARKLLAQMPVTDSIGQYHGVASALSATLGIAGNTAARDAYVIKLNRVRDRLQAMANAG